METDAQFYTGVMNKLDFEPTINPEHKCLSKSYEVFFTNTSQYLVQIFS